ncbi:hypothetical protein BDV95DRAFT_656231 [Massariosphaeria phaeospora]|uniref:FAD-binding PCMH-type domain-containing protein n=1 Tax=Massariosphaeria phaeospora TaxID=100035 RepID=A0A7C8MJC1_9PLEO|nr:hypothetical protein BDV95DRAFT_656231 [Massariosphaeria phaeospora]
MSVSKAIHAVQRISNDLVVLPETPPYDDLTNSYFSALERELAPACFLTPNSATQVSDIVKAIKPFASENDGLKVAVCGVGQQTTPGVANVRGGITIHLKNLRGVEVDKENMVVSVAAGEKMGSVYEEVGKLGLGVAGNRHSGGGIGGDALQGGLSYFSYVRGFISDDVVDFEVVLSNGAIVNANASFNPDFFAALKGGGANFGIVTRFTLRVFELQQILIDYLHEPEPDTGIHICLSLGYAAALGQIMCMNDIFSTGPEKPKALEPFADVQLQIDQMNTLRADSLKGLTDEAFGSAASNRVVKMTTTVKADTRILEYAVEKYCAAFKNLKGVANLLFSLSFEPIPVSMLEASAQSGENAIGLNPSDGPLVVVLFYTSWDNASDDETVYKVNKEALRAIEEEARGKDVDARYRYLKYAFPGQDAIGSYGEERKAHLQAVSAKYDPDRFWQVAGAGPFKLGK